MKKSHEYRELINQKVKELEALVGEEERSLTDEERTKFDTISKEIDELKADEKRAKALEEARLEAAKEERTKAAAKETKSEEEEVKKRFSITNFLQEARDGKLTGLNAEMHQEAKKEARDLGVSVDNFGIPRMVLRGGEKRDMTAGTTTAGGHAIDTQTMGIVDYLENTLVVRSLGADFMTGLTGNISFPVENNSVAASWAAENGTLSESSPTLAQVSMSPKRLGTFVDLSNQLINQTSPSIDARVSARLGGALARGIDSAAIQGTGSSNQPEGILNKTGIGSVAIGTNGGAITWAKVVELFREVDVDNATIGQLAYLTNPLVRAAMQTIEKASNTAQFILNEANAMLNGYQLGVSNHVPSDLDKGSSSGVCSAMIFGNFNDLIIGQWGGLDVMVNPYTKGKEGITEVIATAYADVAITRAQSFAAIADITT
jgi:HK97 family phage major capsid protein